VEDYAKAGRVPRLESGPEFKDSAGPNVPDPESANAIVDVFHHVKDAASPSLKCLKFRRHPSFTVERGCLYGASAREGWPLKPDGQPFSFGSAW
jgi:hypothetical protein